MRLRLDQSGQLEFRSAPRAGTLTIIGVALTVIGSTALLAPGAVTVLRLATAGALFGLGALLTLISLQRPTRLVVDPERRELHVGSRTIPLGDSPKVRLTGSLGDLQHFNPIYTAKLIADRESWTILEDADPARVLSSVRRVQEKLPIHIEPGWGLTDWAPRSRLPSGRSAASGTFISGHREIGWTVVVAALLIGFMMLRSVAGRLAIGTPAPWVSLWVPALVVVAMLLSAALVLSSRATLRVDGGVVWERSILGVPLERTVVDVDRVCGVHAVGPIAGHWTHVLVDCDDRVLALPCPQGDAEERAREVAAALSGTRSPADRAR